jgi:hypothetical protein
MQMQPFANLIVPSARCAVLISQTHGVYILHLLKVWQPMQMNSELHFPAAAPVVRGGGRVQQHRRGCRSSSSSFGG